MTPVRQLHGIASGTIPLDRLVADGRPTLMKGAAQDWPLVRQGGHGREAAMAYLRRFDAGRPIIGYTGAPEIGGRFFYNEDISGLNFQAERVGLSAYLDRIVAAPVQPGGPSFYAGSTDLDTYLPGLRADCDLGLSDEQFGASPTVSAWIGNRTIASTHYDMSNNLACCLVGHRRFTLFPPDEIANLYPGPLEPTPGGQVVSMVDLRAPDLDRFPRFAAALERAEVAEMEPGDVLFYPALWWHNVEALDDFNVMVNYWWNPVAAFLDTPMTTLLHGLLSLRDRPDAEKQAWRAMFDHYIFGPADQAGEHLPASVRGDLAPLDAQRARRLRAGLLQRLNR